MLPHVQLSFFVGHSLEISAETFQEITYSVTAVFWEYSLNTTAANPHTCMGPHVASQVL